MPYFSHAPGGPPDTFVITANAMTIAHLRRNDDTGDWALSGTTLVPFEPVSLDGEKPAAEAARDAVGWVESYLCHERPDLLAPWTDDDE